MSGAKRIHKTTDPGTLTEDDKEVWEKYIQNAKAELQAIHQKRMKVAELALKACKIRWGGCYRGNEWKTKLKFETLKRFAAEIGLGYSTLWDWISVYKHIYPKVKGLHEEQYGINFTAARMTMRDIRRNNIPDTTARVRGVYKAYIKHGTSRYTLKFCMRGLDRVAQFANSSRKDKVSPEDLSFLLGRAQATVKAIERALIPEQASGTRDGRYHSPTG